MAVIISRRSSYCPNFATAPEKLSLRCSPPNFATAHMQLLSPWIMNQFDQGFRAESMAMTLISVGTSTLILVAVTVWQRKRAG